tara:strand:- start:1468 stop:2277 length:810 start_codon:yes stop_codon:yes gene_type:complete
MAKKKWGQHFLKSKSIVESIVQAADVKNGDHILEIGPGYGMLTQALLSVNAEVTAIEIDPDLCSKLRKKFEKDNDFSLLEHDVMKIEYKEFEKLIKLPAKLVANLPYNIATAILLKLLPVRNAWESFTVMVQLEVGERLCAIPESGKKYGPLSLAGTLGFEKKIVKIVSPDCFSPSPKVDSCLIHLLPRNSGLNIDEEKLFLKWSHLLFQHRRKTLLNGIRKHYPNWFQNCKEYLREKYDMRRPETLDFNEWMNLFCNFMKNDKNALGN